MADRYYYNGVLLPEIPAQAIAEAPYCWMRHNGTEVSCFCSSNPNYLKSDGTIAPSAASIFYKYDFDAVTNLWKLFTRWGAAIGGWQAIIDGWNLLWSNHDIPDGSADSTSIYFPAMKAYRAMDVFTPDAVAISRERMTGIADQVRRISGIEGELTPSQMETNLLNVTVGADLPQAENSSFGVAVNKNENGIVTIGATKTYTSKNPYGWEFTAAEAFAVVGFRNKNKFPVKLWDTNGKLIATATPTENVVDGWYSVYLANPVNVAIGETYVVSTYDSFDPPIVCNEFSGTVFNEKLTNTKGRYTGTTSDVFPPYTDMSTMGACDIIIGSVQAELPNSYEIQRTTMDDIAEQVQRLTEATEKLSTARIITGLSEIEVLEDYEEVAF